MLNLKRRYLASEFTTDNYTQILFSKQLKNDYLLHLGWKNISKMPYAEAEKARLREYILHSNEVSLLKISEGYIYVNVWGDGEVRVFLTSRGGSLIEPYTQSFWYSCYSFISKTGRDTISFCESSFQDPGIIENCIWLNSSKNFTHFIFDCLAPVSLLSQKTNYWLSLMNKIPFATLESLNSWQRELASEINIPKVKHIITKATPDTRLKYKVKDLCIPIQTNQLNSCVSLRKYLYGIEQAAISKIVYQSAEIVFITRRDERRQRVANIDEMESLVIKRDGLVVDASKLDIDGKRKVFESCKLCIAEGSGFVNWALFAPSNSKLIHLVHSDVLDKPEFTYGGHIYFLSLVHRINYLIGRSAGTIQGSPLGSSYFDTNMLDDLINSLL